MAKVLIVDDNSDVVERLSQIVIETGNWVTHAYSGKECLQHMDKDMPDIVILDIMMPDLGGFDVLTKIRQDKRAKGVFVILVSSIIKDKDNFEKARRLGADGYISLPLPNYEIISRLDVYLRLSELLKNLESSNRNLNSIVSGNADGMIITGVDNVIKYVNPAAEIMLDKSFDELVGHDFGFPLMHNDLAEIDIISNSGKPRTGEMRYSEILWYGEKAYLVTIRDITEKYDMMIKLAAEKQMLRSVYDGALNSIYIYDAVRGKNKEIIDFTLVNFNRVATQRITWKELKEGMSLIKDFPEISEGFLFEKYKDVCNSGNHEIFNFEYNKLGKRSILKISVNRINDGVVVSIIDITEEEKYKENLKNFNDELTELNKTKDRFFSIISHDLRSPYHYTLGIIEMFLEEYDNISEEDKKKYLEKLRLVVNQQYNFLETMLEWGRIQNGKKSIKRSEMNLYKVTKEITDFENENASTKKIRIQNRINPEITVITDINILKSVLHNLLTNAVKFSYPDSSIEVNAMQENGTTTVSVKDNGIGIPEEYINDLFRIDVSTKSKGTAGEAGSGLGLILCKELIEKQGGKLWVEKTGNSGTEIRFTVTSSLIKFF